MGIAVRRAVRHFYAVIRRFHGRTAGIDAGLAGQSHNLDGLFISRILAVHHVQRNRTVSAYGVRLILRRTIPHQPIIAEAVVVENRVQVHIHRAAAQTSQCDVVLVRTRGSHRSRGHIVILQPCNGGRAAVVHGQGDRAGGTGIISFTGSNFRIFEASDGIGVSVIPSDCGHPFAGCRVADTAASGIGILQARGSDCIAIRILQSQRYIVFLPGCSLSRSQFIVGGVHRKGLGGTVRRSYRINGYILTARQVDGILCLGLDGRIGNIVRNGSIVTHGGRGIGPIAKDKPLSQMDRLLRTVDFHAQVIHVDRVDILAIVASRFRHAGHVGAVGHFAGGFGGRRGDGAVQGIHAGIQLILAGTVQVAQR